MVLKIPDRNLILLATFILAFLFVNYNPSLGGIYVAFMFVYFLMVTTDSNGVTYSLDKRSVSWTYAFLLAIFIYVAFNILSGFILTVVSPMSVAPDRMFQSVAKLQAAATPVLAATGDRIIDLMLTILAWGILVSFIETVFLHGGLLEALEDKFTTFKTRFNLTDRKTWFLVIFISFIFALFHIQAKGLKDSAALLVTFIFAVISIWLIIRYRETKEAVLFHIVANTVAVLAAAGVIS